jgi:hypothetical protein
MGPGSRAQGARPGWQWRRKSSLNRAPFFPALWRAIVRIHLSGLDDGVRLPLGEVNVFAAMTVAGSGTSLRTRPGMTVSGARGAFRRSALRRGVFRFCTFAMASLTVRTRSG